MSRVIDHRIVEMGFENRQFNDGIRESESILSNFQGTLKGLASGAIEGITSLSGIPQAFSGLQGIVKIVTGDFSDFGMIGVGAMLRIGEAAVDAGAKILKSLTIGPVSEGWNEYELKIGSIQTMLNSFTQSERDSGKALGEVNKHLDELNEYADKTIYSFKDMTSNIGKFTNAGVPLPKAVNAIKGVSNAAALAGANSWEASRAMYNFSQALSIGFVNRIDWRSIELANMATVEFKQQLLDGAVAAGTLSKRADGMYDVLTTNAQGKRFKETINVTKNFADSLSYQWMSADALVDVLNQYADETTEIGARATKAATELKTFSMLMGNLTESVGSGWAKTFEIIIGDYDEAIELWTGIGEAVGGVIDKISDARNDMLQDWKNHGGRKELIEMFTGAWTHYIKPKFFDKIKEAWYNVFPKYETNDPLDTFGRRLAAKTETLSYTFLTFWATIKPETIQKVGDVFQGVFSIISIKLDLFRVGLRNAWRVIKLISGPILDLAAMWGRAWSGFSNLNKEFKLFETLGDIIYDYVEWIYEGVSKFLKLIWNGDWNEGFKHLREWFTNLPTLSESTLVAWQKIKEFVVSLGDKKFRIPFTKINTSISEIWSSFLGVFPKIWNWLSQKFPSLTKSIEEWFKNIDWNQVWENIKQGFKDTWAYIKAIFSGDTEDMPELKWFEDLKEYFRNIDWGGVWDSIKSGFMTAVDFVKSIFTGEGIGHDFVQGIIDGIKNTWNKLFGKKEPTGGRGGGGGGSSSSAGPFSNLQESVDGIGAALSDGTYSTEILVSEKISSIRENLVNFGDALKDTGTKILESSTWFRDAWEWIKTVFNDIKTFLSEQWTEVGGLAGIFELFKEFAKGKFLLDIGSMAKGWGGLGELGNLGKIGDFFATLGGTLPEQIQNFTEAFSNREQPKKKHAFRNFMIFIALLTAAVYVLSKIDAGKALEGAGALLAIMAAFVSAYKGFQSMIGKVKKTSSTAMVPFGEKTMEIAKTSLLKQVATLLIFSAALLIIVRVLSRLAKLAEHSGELWEAVGALILLIAMMLGSLYAISIMPQPNTKKLMLQILSLYLFVKVVKKLITPLIKLMILAKWSGNLWEAMAALALLIGGMLGVMYLMTKMKLKKDDAVKIQALATFIKSLAIALDLLIPILVVLAIMPVPAMIQALLGLAALLTMLLIVINVISRQPKMDYRQILSTAAMMLAIGLAMIPLTAALIAISFLKPEDALKSLLVIGILIAMMVVSINAMQGVKGGLSSAAVILAFAASLLILVPLLLVLSLIPIEALAVGLLGLALIVGIMVGAIVLLGNVKGNFLQIAVVMLAFGAAVFLVSAGIALLVGALAVLIPIAAAAGTAIVILLGALGLGLAHLLMNFIIGLGEKMPELRGAIVNIISEFLLMMSAQKLAFIQFLLDFLISLMEGLKERVGVIVGLFMDILIGIIDALIPRVPELITKFVQLFDSIFVAFGDAVSQADTEYLGVKIAAVLIGLFAIIKVLGTKVMAAETAKAMANLALMAGVAGEIALLIAAFGLLAELPEFSSFLASGGELIVQLLDVIGAIINKVLEVVVGAIMATLNAFGRGLSEFTGHLQPFLDGIKGIGDQHLYGTGVLLLIMAEMLGATFLGFVGSFFSNNLPKFAKDISQFWEDITPFVEGVTSLTSADLTAVDVITTSIEKLSKVSTNINNLLGLNGGLTKLGDELVKFAPLMVEYAKILGDVDLTNSSTSASIAEMFANVALALDEIKYDGIKQWFTGTGTSLADFAAMLIPFGESMKKYALSVRGINPEKAQGAAAAALMLAETAKMLNDVPTSNTNWLTAIGLVSEKYNLGTFGNDIASFGESMKKYNDSLGNIDINKVSSSTAAAQMLASIAVELNKIDSDNDTWFKRIGLFGQGTSLTSFGAQIIDFGSSMAAFGLAVTDLDSGKVENAANAGKMLVELYKELNSDKGFWDWVLGTITLSDFADDLTHFGNSLVSFDESTKSLDGDFTNVDKFFKELVKLSDMIYDAHINTIHIDGMATGLAQAFERIIEAMSAYVDEVGATDGKMGISFSTMMSNMGTVITNNADEIQSAYNDIMDGLDGPEGSKKSTAIANAIALAFTDGLGDGIESDKPRLETYGGNAFHHFYSGLQTSAGMPTNKKPSEGDTSSVFKSIGISLANSMITGYGTKNESSKSVVASMLSLMKLKIYDSLIPFTQAGKDLASGFISGINSKVTAAAIAAANLAKTATNAARDNLRIESPSKVFYQIGVYVVEGFVNAINSMAYRAEKATETLADDSVNPVIQALQMISSIADGNFDYQPRITPIVDLSNVVAGANKASMLMNEATQYSANLANKAAASRIAKEAENIQNGINQKTLEASNMVANHFHMDKVIIREEADIQRVAIELKALQDRALRGRGIKTSPGY